MQSILCLQNKAVLQNLKCFGWCIDPPFFFMKQSIFAKFEMFWLIHRSPLIQDIAESIRASGLNFNKFFATLTFKTYTSRFFQNIGVLSKPPTGEDFHSYRELDQEWFRITGGRLIIWMCINYEVSVWVLSNIWVWVRGLSGVLLPAHHV